MTNHPIAEQDSLEALIARLRAKRFVREIWHEPDGTMDVACDEDDYGAQPIFRNPDGPEAADTLSQMRDALLQIESKRPLNIVQARSIARLALTTTKIEKDAQPAVEAADTLSQMRDALEFLLGQFDQAHVALCVERSPSAQAAIVQARAALTTTKIEKDAPITESDCILHHIERPAQ